MAAQGENLLRAGLIMATFALGVSTIILAPGYGAWSALKRRRTAMRAFAERARPLMGAVFAAVFAGGGVALLLRVNEPGMVDAALAEGRTVFLDFYTTWCGACDRRERVINALRAENPAYDEAVTFIRADWDQHSRSDLAQRLRIPRRSTMVERRGEAEIGRPGGRYPRGRDQAPSGRRAGRPDLTA
jgi:hypothetical protein